MNYMDLTMEEKENQAIEIIKKGLIDAKNPFILFDGRIESLIVLHLLRQVNKGKIPFPVLHIDTSVEFNEIYQYIEKMKKLWGFRLIKERNEEALKTIKFAEDREKCCGMLKYISRENAIKKYNIDRLFAFQDRQIKTNMESFKLLDERIMTYPIQHFSQDDVWEYIKKYNLAYCSLYDKGYNNIQCTPCIESLKPKDEKLTKKEEDEIKKRLKALGYM